MNSFKVHHWPSVHVKGMLYPILSIHKKSVLIQMGPSVPVSCGNMVFTFVASTNP